jgi:opacity protein-like surface antigen
MGALMSRAIRILLCLVSMAAATPLVAQTSDRTEQEIIARIKDSDLHWFLGGDLQIVNPQGALRDSLQKLGAPDVGIGFDFKLGYYMAPVPVAFTLEGGAVFMGGESKELYTQSGLFRDTITVSTSTTQIPLNMSVRFMPDLAHWVFPYVEGVVGINIHSSSFDLSQRRFEEVRSQSDSRSDVAFNYGVGAGVSLKIADIVNLPNSLQRILLDVRMRYLFGDPLEVSTVDMQVDANDPQKTTYTFKSATVDQSDMVYFNIGFSFQF